ncbi:MAG: response regulator [Candidatus Delongbacteria bacterium]|nr:response regulator [Candidatus Delongbacteria bacterium]
MTRVLVVDDVEDMRDILRQFVEVFGFEAMTAGSGNEALEIFKNNDIDLIITDIMMDNGDGFELVKGAREIRKDIPVIFITGYEVDNARERAANLGANGFLAKPFSIKELKELIDGLL